MEYRYCGCGKAYKYKQHLNRHIKNKHNGKAPEGTEVKRSGRPSKGIKLKKFVCDECGLDYQY